MCLSVFPPIPEPTFAILRLTGLSCPLCLHGDPAPPLAHLFSLPSFAAYEMVDIFESWVASMVIFSVVAAMLLGLQEIAGAMADPFGVDDTDFDTHKLCYDAYKNAVAYLRVKQPTDPEAGIGDDEPRVNPVANAQRPCHSPSRAQSATNDTNDASSSAGASLMLSQASACPAPQTSSAVSPPQAKAWSLVTKRGGGGARV